MRMEIMIFIITVLLIGFVNWIVANVFHTSFLDVSFMIGMLTTLILYFVNSSDSPVTRAMNADIQGETGTKVHTKSRHSTRGVSFYAALVYLVAAAIVTFTVYWDAFF